MNSRLFILAIIFSLVISLIPELKKQTIAVASANLGMTSEMDKVQFAHNSLSKTSNNIDSTIQVFDPITSEDIIGRIVPSKCLTGKGMVVEEISQTSEHVISSLYPFGIFIIFTGFIYMALRLKR
ncbi:hypothetical protein F7984_05160 [Pradoshia sp. D12]|uniref:hypothetical protein n=1 Tax=Bacillaceae TaxID=186817 RepID=UPI00080AEF9B|nr:MULTISPECIES: hypothetical protein [Bacillaceae]OCA89924.1 hypothetical protein A8L44_03050 [Bacillus sp. FJAT-27986]QFK70671.1 hypothetical protein F7984_05160 [Pradoshia sp. D12]TPF72466.1 hypothetical protein FHY44_01555 [Bacillus sp. D12]